MRTFPALISAALAVLVMAAAVPRSLAAQPVPRVTDQAGRTVAVARPFARIISLYGAHTENLFALGAGAAVIGVARSDRFPPEARQKPVFSYHDGLERFLAAAPDLVLIRPMIDRGYAPLISGLEKSGNTVVSLPPTAGDDM